MIVASNLCKSFKDVKAVDDNITSKTKPWCTYSWCWNL